MISRLWHGYTTPANADSYESLLKEEIFISISNRKMSGYRGIQLFRRTIGSEVEFILLCGSILLRQFGLLQETIMRQRLFLQRREYCFHDLTNVHSIMR
jgi:hypothetical protein